jgi:hypothetical protein
MNEGAVFHDSFDLWGVWNQASCREALDLKTYLPKNPVDRFF